MAKLTNLEKVRRQRARKRLIRNLFVLGIFGLIVYLCITLIHQIGEMDLKTAYSDIKAESGSGNGFPVTMPGGEVRQLQRAGDSLMLLTDTNIYSYNATGKQMLNAQHGMADQTMSVARERTLLYDRSGSRITLYSKSSQVSTMTSEQQIFTADLAANGNFAVVTASDTHMAQVTVYNREMQWFYRWKSYRPVVSAALSDVRDEMMVGCVDVEDGGYLSSISRFLLSTEKELNRIELADELLVWLDYTSGGNTLRAITDKRVILFNSDLHEIGSFEFGTRKLNRFYSAREGMVLVFGDHAADKCLELVTLDEAFQLQGMFEVAYDIIDLKADSDYIYLASRDQIEVMRYDGTTMVQIELFNLHNIEPIDGQLYYATGAELGVLPTREAINQARELERARKNQERENASSEAAEPPTSSDDDSSSSTGAEQPANSDTGGDSSTADTEQPAGSAFLSEDAEQPAASSSSSKDAEQPAASDPPNAAGSSSAG